MRCEEHFSLLTNYKKAVNTYTQSVKKLTDHAIDIPQVEFMLLWRLAGRAGEKCRSAQSKLHQHIMQHNC